MKNIKIYLTLIIASLFLTGCYTQLAMKQSDYEKYNERQEEEYYGEYEDTSEYYSDEYYTDEYYEEDDNLEIHNYYFGYPTYRRYYWGYYPTISIGFHYGWSWYYDPFCWDPYYWCGTIYNPYYYSHYYYPGYYYWGHYYPYYGYYGGKSIYKERTTAGLRLRNNDGLRSGLTTRGTFTRTNDRSLNRTRSRDDIELRNPTRTRVTERNTNINKRGVTERNKTSVERNRNNVERERRISKEKKNTPPKNIKRTETNRNTRKNSVKEERKTKTPKYTPPKRTNTPRSYSPPKNNTPKSYSPPRNNTPRGNTNSGNRSGNRGSRDSGRRR